jgi:hypothetical protein
MWSNSSDDGIVDGEIGLIKVICSARLQEVRSKESWLKAV